VVNNALSGRPRAAVTDVNIDKVEQLLKIILKGTVWKIICVTGKGSPYF
jgi:hypothetical protein